MTPTGRRPPEEVARAVLDVVAVMDRLRSPGGCPWDAEQTHASLAPYAVEEGHEVAEAAERGDRSALREELGDLLLQVLFHARIAQEHPTEPFDVADVAESLRAKLVRRHPHVFGDGAVRATAGQVEADWERIKAEESTGAGRTDPLASVPANLPALARAQKVLRRLRRADLIVQPDTPAASDVAARVGAELAELVARAEDAGVDAEAALRAHVRAVQERATTQP
ncbi:MazG family protein [Georgenia sp. 10Sc9-8]|uniref:MazG family protein n=1 Tax=Georgenia halotolerans TaxID=3028317 RepID=A0ABT5TX06_9MICO|nr:MazG family protein [Georgenia halotolerans]